MLRCLAGLLLLAMSVNGFVERQISASPHKAIHRRPALIRLRAEPVKKNFLQTILDPYPTNIPPELKDEIYKAEGNTPAAKERSQRVLIYGIIGVVLVTCAFTNGFLTELRSAAKEIGEEVSPADFGFGWVESNFLFKFIFMNGLGGAIALLAGAGSGMMAEAEMDSRRKNAEKIYEELVRRREEKGGKEKTKPKAKPIEASKKKQSATQKKRLAAISEVVLEDETPPVVEVVTDVRTEEAKDDGILGKLKGFYAKADSMAASQALLLNKELEDRGVIEKITDETGLKVIGRDAAAAKLGDGNNLTKENESASNK
jgi:hypothetical protein